jgi:acyl transferase domain-containing protein
MDDSLDLEFDHIAVVGMAVRFPGADDPESFWENLVAGRSAIETLTDTELAEAGVPEALAGRPDYVRACSAARDLDAFDAEFFGINPAEAATMDPQHRVLLECAYNAIENAGYRPGALPGLAGLFAGTGPGDYMFNSVPAGGVLSDMLSMQLLTGNAPSYACTRIAYRLDLRGPALAVDTACSTSLVAVHLACRSLLFHDCDIALAGAARVIIPTRSGYLFEAGGVRSADGQCRPFDAQSSGVIAGSGAGMLVLKRLVDARRDGDRIRAVIRGSAVNNDGRERSDYTAPSVQGQAALIAQALRSAQLNPDDIGYIEAHGTGTALGDPIEINALDRAFRGRRADLPKCRIGSVKSNLGHLDVAAGAAGLVKTILALEKGIVPPSANYSRPNPRIDFGRSRFEVADAAAPWPENPSGQRIAGVSGFGIGGTNAHILLSEAPQQHSAPTERGWHLLPVSATDEERLKAVCERLGPAIAEADAPIEDIAFTLATGREALPWRSHVVTAGAKEAGMILAQDQAAIAARASRVSGEAPPVAFLFSGQGARILGAGRDLYRAWPLFRSAIDECAAGFLDHSGTDVRDILLAAPDDERAGAASLDTAHAQAAIFALEIALARLWAAWGLKPGAMIGHSAGELAMAHVAGILSLDDAIRLVSARGAAMNRHGKSGSMLAVALDEERTGEVLRQAGGADVWISSVNARTQTVVAGSDAGIDALAEALSARGVQHSRLAMPYAFHSPLVEPAAKPFAEAAGEIGFGPPAVRLVSTLTGAWAGEGDLTTPAYWERQLHSPVRFRKALETLSLDDDYILLEVGPGQALLGFALEHLRAIDPERAARLAIASMPRSPADSAERVLLSAAGSLWQAGVAIDFAGMFAGEQRLRVPLPGYPFKRTRHQPPAAAGAAGDTQLLASSDRLYVPGWTRSADVAGAVPLPADTSWIILSASAGAAQVAEWISGQGGDVRVVELSSLPPDPEAVEAAVAAAIPEGARRIVLVHGWMLQDRAEPPEDDAGHHLAYGSVTAAIRALAAAELEAARLLVVAKGSASVAGEAAEPWTALALGPVRTAPLEIAGLQCSHVDFDSASLANPALAARRIVAEARAEVGATRVAYRNGRRFTETFMPVREAEADAPAIRAGGIYLLLGGLGAVGLVLAERLADRGAGTLILTGRSPLHPDDPRASRIEALRARGLRVESIALDATDDSAMARLADRCATRFGPLNGIVNGVGIASPAAIADRPAAESRRVIDAKVASTRNLARHFDMESLDFAILMSSIMAYAPLPGLSDYAAANSWLDAYAAAAGAPVTSIAWDGWAGMGLADSGASLPVDTIGRLAFRIDAERDWRVRDHVINGQPILPGAATIDLMVRAASAAAAETSPVMLERIRLVRAIVPDESGAVRGMIAVRRRDDGRRQIEVRGARRELGILALGDVGTTGEQPRTLKPGLLPDSWTALPGGLSTLLGTRAQAVHLGDRWDSARRYGHRPGRLVLEARMGGEHIAEAADFAAHPAMFDLCTGIAAGYLLRLDGRVGDETALLPGACRELIWFAPLGGSVTAIIETCEDEGLGGFSFDIALYGEDGRERVRLAGFELIAMAGADMTAPLSRAPAQASAATAAPVGLSAAEGADLFERALSRSGLPNLLVSVVPPAARIAAQPKAGATRRRGGDLGQEALAPDAAAEATPLQRDLAALWAEQIGRGGLGLDDDFFSLGGSSLDAMQIATRARAELGLELDVRSMFEAPTLRALAATLPQVAAADRGNGLRIVPRQPGGEGVALAPQQMRMWAMDRMGADPTTYNIAAPLETGEPLDLSTLTKAWLGLLGRHESLRTRIVTTDSLPRQYFDSGDARIPTVDISGLAEADRERVAAATRERMMATPFTLSRGGLARLAVLRMAPGRHQLLVMAHHVIADHWSIGILYADLLRLYRGDSLDPPPLQYGDYAEALGGEAWQGRLQSQIGYWQRKLTGAPQALDLPADHPRNPEGNPGATEIHSLGAALVGKLESLARARRASLYMLLLAGYGALLGRLTGEQRVVIGSPVANRPDQRLEEIIGFFANTVALDLTVDPEVPFIALVDETRDTVRDALANQEAGFDLVVDRLKVRPQPGRTPLFETMFVLQNAPMPDIGPGALKMREVEMLTRTAKFDLTLTLYPAEGGGLSVLCEYRRDLFDDGTVRAWLREFEALLTAAAATPEEPVARLAAPEARAAAFESAVEEFVL